MQYMKEEREQAVLVMQPALRVAGSEQVGNVPVAWIEVAWHGSTETHFSAGNMIRV